MSSGGGCDGIRPQPSQSSLAPLFSLRRPSSSASALLEWMQEYGSPSAAGLHLEESSACARCDLAPARSAVSWLGRVHIQPLALQVALARRTGSEPARLVAIIAFASSWVACLAAPYIMYS